METPRVSSNILTYLRIRCPLGEEAKYPQIVSSLNDGTTVDVNGQKYHFCRVLPPNTTQPQVFDIIGQPFIKDILQGYNGTIFVYGLSGTGKSFTMTGYSDIIDKITDSTAILWKDPKDMGLVPRIVQALFKEIYKQEEYEFSLQVSYLEIYMEKIRDLLNPQSTDLQIRESNYKGLWVEDATQLYVTSFDDLIKIMRKAEINRTVASTLLNSHSSRSHSVFTIRLSKTDTKTGARIRSKMTFVDLAGSEKIEKTGATGLVLKQAQYNNKSLLTLGIVIRDLAEKKPHIRYRDSKLTRMLSESLGGNSRTALIATCSPSAVHLEETLSTMRFASLTGQIKNSPKINKEMTADEYRKQLVEANAKIATQQLVIESLEKDVSALIKLCESKGIDVQALKKLYSLSLKKSVEINSDLSADDEIQRLQEITEELRIKTGMVGELQSLIDRLHNDLRKAEDDKQVLSDLNFHQLSAMEATLSLKKEYEEERLLLSEENKNLRDQLRKLSEEKTSIDYEGKIRDLTVAVDTVTQSRDNLQRDYDKLHTQSDHTQAELEALKQEKDVLQTCIDSMLSEISSFKQEKESLQSQLQSTSVTVQILREQSAQSETKLSSVQSELEKIRQKETSEWRPHTAGGPLQVGFQRGHGHENITDEEIQKIKGDLEGKTSHISVLESQIADLKGQIRQYILEIKSLKKSGI
jgi:kinesin family member 5